MFADSRQVVLLHQNLGERLKVEVGLVLVPKEEVLEASAFNLDVKLDRDQLEVGLVVVCCHTWERAKLTNCLFLVEQIVLFVFSFIG